MSDPKREEPAEQAGGSLPWALIGAQAEFARTGDAQRLFERLLALLIEGTASTYGFLGEALRTPGESPRIHLLASTPASWMDALRELPTGEATQAQEPRGLPALISMALATGQPVMPSAGLASHGDARFLPGRSPLDSLVLLPLEVRGERVGLVGLANRPGGYDSNILRLIQPVLTVSGSSLHAWRCEQRVHQLEEELHLTQAATMERPRLALACVEDDLWDWNLATQELHVSRRCRALLGYTEEELDPTVCTWRRLCHPEDLPKVEQHLREHLEGAAPLAEFEYRARRKDGSWAWLLSRARVVERDRQGRPLRMMGTDTDITARKHDEERLGAITRAIPDLFFRMRGDGTYIDFTAGSTEELVLDPEDFIGRNMRDLPLPRHFTEKALFHLEHVIREGTLDVFEYDLEVNGGRQFYEARLARSGPDEAVGIVRNITERKMAEQRQAQLIQSEKLASIGQLAAGIAHEINNPVSYVASNLNTLGKYVSELTPLLQVLPEVMSIWGAGNRLPPPALLARLRELWNAEEMEFLLKDMPELIQESAMGTRRIAEIVRSLRLFAREDSEDPLPVDLNAELESTLRMVWNELKYKCTVKRDFGPLPAVTCFPSQITQVFTNLLVNAAQAIETHGEIRIRTWRQEHEAVVEISDTGQGMTPETLSNLFTPFFTTKPRGQGTGLGLSITHDIIARHQGRIEVRSEPGKGSTFTIYLPVAGVAPTLPPE